MREGSVGKVSGVPLFASDERRDEAPVERPRDESETVSTGDAELNTAFSDVEVEADDVRMGKFAPTALARLVIL